MVDKMYTLDLTYNYPSSIGSSAETLDEIKKKLAYYIGYYTKECGYDPEKFEYSISEVCPSCMGRGEIFKPNKRMPRIGKHVKCPTCRGKNSEVKII